jgi:uncharacterized spore protein YtfJ
LDIGDPIKTTVEEISKVLNIGNVVGEPLETNEIMLIPVTKMGMGFGVGMGEGKEKNGKGTGAGGGAGIEPTAIVVVSKGVIGPESVKIMYLKSPDPLTRAIGEIGNTVIKIMDKDQKMIKEIYMNRKLKKEKQKELKNQKSFTS